MAKLFIFAESDSKHVFHKPENMLITLRSRKSQQCTTFTLAIKMSNEPIKRRADVCSAVSSFYLTPYCEMDDTGVKPGRKRNRRKDRSFIGLKSLNTIQPTDALSVSFARTNGFLYRVETGGGQTVGRTKQMYAHLQRDHEYLVELGDEWEVAGVRLETPVSSRELRYRIDDSQTGSQSQIFGRHCIGLYHQYQQMAINWSSNGERASMIPQSFFESDYFTHIFRNASTGGFPSVEPESAETQQPPQSVEEIPYFSSVHAVQAPPSSISTSTQVNSNLDELSSVTSTASTRSLSWIVDDEVVPSEVAGVTFDTTDARSFRPLQPFYALQDPIFDTWNPLAVPVDPITSVMYTNEVQPFDFPAMDSNSAPYILEDGSCNYTNEEGKGNSAHTYYPPDIIFGDGMNEESSVSDGTQSSYDSNSLGSESPNSLQYSVSQSENAGSYGQSPPGCSNPDGFTDEMQACWEELVLLAGTDFVDLFEKESGSERSSGANDSNSGAGVNEPGDSTTNASYAESQPNLDIQNLDSTTCIPFNYLERRDYHDDSSPLPPTAILADTITDLCVSGAATIPAKHFQSLFFLVWSFLAQMEVSILMSAFIISQLVQKHSSQLAKSQQTFLFNSHLSDKITRHSYGTVEFCRSTDFPEINHSRMLLSQSANSLLGY